MVLIHLKHHFCAYCIALIMLVQLPTSLVARQDNSVLSQGHWLKVGIAEAGIYRITANELAANGFNLGNINPQNLAVYGNGAGMLPQPNNEPRIADLQENAVVVVGEADGRFDGSDYILFYAQGPDSYSYTTESNLIDYQHHDYSTLTYYYITEKTTPGLRPATIDNLTGNMPEVTTYLYYEAHEIDQSQILVPGSGREWYGERFDLQTSYDLTYTLPGVLTDGNNTFAIDIAAVAQTFGSASMDVALNGTNAGRLVFDSIPTGTYSVKGAVSSAVFEVNTSTLPTNDGTYTVTLNFNKNPAVRSLAFLDYLLVSTERTLTYRQQPLPFMAPQSTAQPNTAFIIGNATEGLRLWNITQPTAVSQQTYATQGSNISFGAASAQLQEYLLFADDQALAPQTFTVLPNQNLRGASVPDMLVITHSTLMPEAERLAAYRRSHDGLAVNVVDVALIYNEFSSGATDVTAIRDYVRHLYLKGSGQLKYLLLFGKTSYDYRDITPDNVNLVPTYEARNSLHPIFSYSSDDYFGFMDDDEGTWTENALGDHDMEIGIGRLPVANLTEAAGVVDKLMAYGEAPQLFGDWKNDIFFVADDGDNNRHQLDAERLTNQIELNNTQYNLNKVYLDAFQQTKTGNGEVAPTVNDMITTALDEGALIMNFVGHGGEVGWTEERILDLTMISQFDNAPLYPLFVTATCEFGRHDDPGRRSGGERLVINPRGGAIALVTTSRPVFASTNLRLNQAFYNAVFLKEDNQHLRLGDIFRLTKNNSLNGSVNRNFSLLGDPSLLLAFPENQIKVTAINGAEPEAADTLKALSTVVLEGEVTNIAGQRQSNFNGTLSLTLFDKPLELQTLGSDGPSMRYTSHESVLYRGTVTVNEGAFTAEFIVPLNISYRFGAGRITMYAASETTDAAGAEVDFVIGGTESAPSIDDTPPELEVFLDSRSFQPGDRTGTNALLLAFLADESGISISSSGIGQGIIATLDDSVSFNLNEFYTTALDDFTSGSLTFPLRNMSLGAHTLNVKAWDSHNNPTQVDLPFIVAENFGVAITELFNYPNPLSTQTTFSIGHNRLGDDLNVTVEVYSIEGQIIYRYQKEYSNAAAVIDDVEWNNRNSTLVNPGLYLYRVTVQSLNDGAKKERIEKLVIIK